MSSKLEPDRPARLPDRAPTSHRADWDTAHAAAGQGQPTGSPPSGGAEAPISPAWAIHAVPGRLPA